MLCEFQGGMIFPRAFKDIAERIYNMQIRKVTHFPVENNKIE